MIVLEIDNSYSQIKGLKTDEFRAFRKILSYESDPQAAYFSGGLRRRKYLIDSKGWFPTGLASRVVDFCLATKLDLNIVDKRMKPKINPVNVVRIPKAYPDQIRAKHMAMQSERGTISMPTGTGKSRVIQMIAETFNVKTLVVVPNLGILSQLEATLEDLPNVTVLNIDSPKLKKLKDFDCLIIDEAHHVAAKTYQELNKNVWNGIYYRFFLTATPFRNQESEMLLFEAIAGDLIYQLSYEDAVYKGYIVPVEAFYVNVPKQPCNGYTWNEVYSELVVRNDVRNQMIAYLSLKLQSEDKSTLILVKEIAHGNILSKMTGIEFANGVDGSTDLIAAFNSGAIKALIATEGIMAEGIDSKPAEYIIIAGLGKAKSSFQQKVGRGVRRYPGKDSCKVILFQDKSHKFCSRHFKAQCDILKVEYNVTPIKLEI